MTVMEDLIFADSRELAIEFANETAKELCNQGLDTFVSSVTETSLGK